MEKKKLTKEQLKERKDKFNKWCKRLLIISLAVNVFFVICTIVGSCSNKPKVTSAATNNNSQVAKVMRQTNNASLNNYHYCGFELTSVDTRNQTASILNGSGYAFNGNIDNNVFIVNNGSTRSINIVSIRANVHLPNTSGDSIYIWGNVGSTNRIGIRWEYSVPNGWVAHDIGSELDASLGFGIFFEQSEYPELYSVCRQLFTSYAYTDFDLTSNWSPYAYFDMPFGIITPLNQSNAPSSTIIDNAPFFINGVIFDNLKIGWLDISFEIEVVQSDGTIKTFNNGWVMNRVYAYNSSTQREYTIWKQPKYTISDNQKIQVYPYKSGFNDLNLGLISLSHFNYNAPTVGGYVNGNVLNATYYYSGGGNGAISNESFGNAFSLISDAFVGVSRILNISILPGITIGVLIAIPLVGVVIFAIVKLLKK